MKVSNRISLLVLRVPRNLELYVREAPPALKIAVVKTYIGTSTLPCPVDKLNLLFLFFRFLHGYWLPIAQPLPINQARTPSANLSRCFRALRRCYPLFNLPISAAPKCQHHGCVCLLHSTPSLPGMQCTMTGCIVSSKPKGVII
jgi:hypothetical protein